VENVGDVLWNTVYTPSTHLNCNLSSDQFGSFALYQAQQKSVSAILLCLKKHLRHFRL